MKKILVPTDFSLQSQNAAVYAMHMAKMMRVNVKLCNAIMSPINVPLGAEVSWPMVEYNALERESTEELMILATKLDELFKMDAANSDSFLPAIGYVTGVGAVSEVVNNLSYNHEVQMIVMGIVGAGRFTQFLLGSNSRKLLETVEIPVLLVPKDCRFKGIEKILFATDLSKSDISLIQELSNFARVFDAKILLVHVTDNTLDVKRKSQEVNSFVTEAINKTSYPKIHYEYLWNSDVDDGLAWLARQDDLSILAMVHRKHSMFYRIFKGSHTQRVKNRIKLPLLVLPEIISKR